MNRKGFTLVEVLAVVVIMGILSTIAIVSVQNIIKRSHTEYFEKQEQLLVLAAKSYYSDYKNELPKSVGQTENISLKDLIDGNYIKQIVDYNKKECDSENSYVEVSQNKKNVFEYKAHLVC